MEKFPSSSKNQVLSEKERDKQYRQILEQTKLSEAHCHYLTSVRGLGGCIDFIAFRSWEKTRLQNVSANLPGVVRRYGSLHLYGQRGIFLPCKNEFGQIIGFQLCPDTSGFISNQYKLGSEASMGGNSPILDNGEMPLAFCRPPVVRLPSIGLAQGVLKSWSVACNLQQIVIGAFGTTWNCSPQLFKRYLEKIAQEQSTLVSNLVIDLYVDAGILSNKEMMLHYHQTIKLLQHWGCNISIAWWGQFNQNDLNIDDLILKGGRHQLTYISIDEWIALWSDDIRSYLLEDNIQPKNLGWLAPVRHPYRAELGYWKKFRNKSGDNKEYSWIPKAGFSFIVERELVGVDNNCGGLVLQVKRSNDPPNEEHRVVVSSLALNRVRDFTNCLSRATGKKFFASKLRIDELHGYIHNELSAYRERGGKAYKLTRG